MRTLLPPSVELVEKYATLFVADQVVVEKALGNVFRAFPGNVRQEDVLIKVATLNTLYRTNILAVWQLAEHIVNLQIDDKLNHHSLTLVDEIAPLTIAGKTRRNYSFASKYCAWHMPEVYPIYDSFVDQMLREYQRAYGYSSVKRLELWNNYPSFTRAILDFREHFGLEEFTLKQLDAFLWLYGKQYISGLPTDGSGS